MTNALLQAIEQDRHGNLGHIQCHACRAIRTLNPEERDTLNDAVTAQTPWAVLTRALQSLGHTLGEESLSKHYRGGHQV